MQTLHEKPFTKNGFKNWVECIDIKTSPRHSHNSVLHYHDYIELLYAYNADASVVIGDEIHPFNRGNLVLINSNEPHTVIPNKDSHYICIKVLPSILYANEESFFELKYVIPFTNEGTHQNKFTKEELSDISLEMLIDEIIHEWNNESPAYELVIRADILKIFAGIFRYWNGNNITPVSLNLTDTIKKALSYMSENYASVSAVEVADECGLSYNYFSSVFKNAVGKNFKDYLLALRLKEAQKKLISTNDSITDIALSCGFSTASHFISKFKEFKNTTPKKFRELTKNT